MNKKELRDLGKMVKTAFGYKPKERTRQPKNPPTKAEAERLWRIKTPSKAKNDLRSTNT